MNPDRQSKGGHLDTDSGVTLDCVEEDSQDHEDLQPGRNAGQALVEFLTYCSPWLGTFGSVGSLLSYRWFRFYSQLDLGDNDFAGLFYLVGQCLVLIPCSALAVSAIAGGAAGLARDQEKRRPAIGLSLGVLAVVILIIANR